MLSYRDRAFCASPNCNNVCGRQITDKQRAEAIELDMPIAWGYFCDVPEEVYQSIKENEAPE